MASPDGEGTAGGYNVLLEESQYLELEGTQRSPHPIADKETKDQLLCHLHSQY